MTTVPPATPDAPLTCLLVQPKFSQQNYWNYTAVADRLGAKTPAAPLGLLTVAALLPQQWSLSLVDLNVRGMTAEEWDAADVICVGGMLPQQGGILEIIERANRDGKYVAVGGADPSSQPEIYDRADALVIGEGEASIPLWLDAWRGGEPCGRFEAPERPDVALAPLPRFDLVDFRDYVHVGVQFSRGCPFNCEFCDIIELYGRVPRTKSTEQFLAELERLYQLGYRGWVDVVDDNFIGNKQRVKPMLRALAQWSRERNYPFFFSTEATMNLADDEEFLELMREVDFRFVFMGIETPDPATLAQTQKRVNSMSPIRERVAKVYEYGISVTAGFILGFDEEKAGADEALIRCIDDAGIVVAMVGLLVALPNTQLTRRLQREGRLLSPELTVVPIDDPTPYRLQTAGTYAEGDDQAGGLNFLTLRDRVEIFREYRRVVTQIYSPRPFMDRVLATARRLRPRRRHRTNWHETKRDVRALARLAWWMTRRRETRWLYWRNSLLALLGGVQRFDFAQSMMLMYLHLGPQSQHVTRLVDQAIDFAEHEAEYPRQIDPAELASSANLPIVAS